MADISRNAEESRAAAKTQAGRRTVYVVVALLDLMALVMIVASAYGLLVGSDGTFADFSPVFILVIIVSLLLIVCFFVLVRYTLSSIEKEDSNRLISYAYKDRLTQGNNFNWFADKITECSYRAVIVSMDIDSFKDINSICGIERGDLILIAIWRAIEKALNEGDMAARVSGDRFVILLKDPEDHGNGRYRGTKQLDNDLLPARVKLDIAARLDVVTDDLAQLSRDMDSPLIKPRYGVYPWNPTKDMEECYSRAITAARHVKVDDEDRIAFFSAEDFEKINEETATIQAFQGALEAGEFEAYYQPKFKPEGKLAGAEALVRWRKSDGSVVPPRKFVPLFERNGMIRQLDREMFIQVCKQQAAWKEEGIDIVPISINLSRASLRFQGVRNEYVRIAREYGVDPQKIPIEITESALATDKQVSTIIQDFRVSGFPIHMDDFGSGYSSLSALGSMSFDAIKLDKSLIDCIGGETGTDLLRHCVELAQEMKLYITAEGVERRDQVEYLRSLHVDSIQGFYFSRPIPLNEFEVILRQARG